MHELLHIAILTSTLLGAAAILLLILWPLLAEQPLGGPTRAVLWLLIGLGATLFLVEWRWVH